MYEVLVATNIQKILDYLIRQPDRQFLAGEIQKATKISKTGVNLSLRELTCKKLVRREKKGKVFLYSVDHTQPIIKQLRVLKNIEFLNPLISKIKGISKKIVLFGSCARGENTAQSDIDLFILTNNSKAVEGVIRDHKFAKRLQLIIRTPVTFVEMERKEPVFFEEVSRGITLWESKE